MFLPFLLSLTLSALNKECEICMSNNWKIRWLAENGYSPTQISSEMIKFCENYKNNVADMCKRDANNQFNHFKEITEEGLSEQKTCYYLKKCPNSTTKSKHAQNIESDISEIQSHLSYASEKLTKLGYKLEPGLNNKF
jgi:oligoendopeptidase F